jgi:hypothetical protein
LAQVAEHNPVHAPLHPGLLLVSPSAL